MKKAIATRCDNNIHEMASLTHPILKRYAKICNADFVIFDNDVDYNPHYKILQMYDLFGIYDRIACIGTDTIILKYCPNIFDEVPYHKIGSVLEDVGSIQESRRNRMAKIQKERDYVGWTEGYINSDVAVFSKTHRDVFNNENLYLDHGYDDVFLGYNINRLGHLVHELSYPWNHMSVHSEEWNKYASRFDSYIVHYAGRGFHALRTKTEQIRMDLSTLNKQGLTI